MSLTLLIVIFVLGGLLGGRLFTLIKLPSVLGMVFVGVLSGYLFKVGGAFALEAVDIDSLNAITPFLKSFALTVILLRAGLGISRSTLRKTGVTALFMSFVPGIFEGTILLLSFHYFFNFSWAVAGLTAFMVAAVSPAVVVPSMLKLKEEGYGEKKEVPTIVMAGASVDDVVAITLFSLFLGMATGSETSLFEVLFTVPRAIILGVIPGVLVGFGLTWYLKNYNNKVRATEKGLILIMSALLLVDIGDTLQSAALLGVMAVGFVILERTPKIAHELSDKLGKIWVFAEIMLFVLIGFAVDLGALEGVGLTGVMVIAFGLLARSIGVMVATLFSPLNYKERLFCVIAYLPKATVQAALGGVALSRGVAQGEMILAIAVLSIVFTAPLGLIGINLFGKKLLDIE